MGVASKLEATPTNVIIFSQVVFSSIQVVNFVSCYLFMVHCWQDCYEL